MGVIGVGEATTFAFPNYLHGRLKIEPGEFHRSAQPTWKRNQVLDARNPFGFEGYLSMMIGMNVPYRRTHAPPEQEMRVWQNLSQRFQAVASQAVSVPEALSCIRASWWQWPANPYRDTRPQGRMGGAEARLGREKPAPFGRPRPSR
jgi:hypothetical protein